MSSLSPELAAHLAGEVTTLCHCWRLTRTDGATIGFTDHDRPLTVGGTLFRPRTGFAATEARDTLGLAIDTVDVEGALSSEDIGEADIAAGVYDDATVETLLVNWRDPTMAANLRKATVGRITRRDDAYVAELKSAMHALDQIGGRTVSRRCDAALGDGRCRFDLTQAGFFAVGTVAAAPTPEILRVTGLEGFAAGWFARGTVAWTSGALAGRSSHVVGHTRSPGGVDLALQAGEGAFPQAGDAFVVRAGCDKTFATCKAKFANALNFQGFPHLPGNDSAYGYATDGGVFDGAPLVP